MITKGSYAYSDIPDFVKMGNYCSIAKDVVFHPFSSDHLCIRNHEVVFTTNWEQPQGLGEIVLGHDVWIAEGVRILNGVHIGNGAIVGAGAVVANHVPPYAVVVGNRSSIVRYRFTPDVIEKLQKIAWWEWDENTVKDRLQDLKSVTGFIEKYG